MMGLPVRGRNATSVHTYSRSQLVNAEMGPGKKHCVRANEEDESDVVFLNLALSSRSQ